MSAVVGIACWPVVQGLGDAALAPLMAELSACERLPAEAFRVQQALQFERLHAHLVAHSPFHRERLQQAGLADRPLTLETLAELPVLERRTLQAAGERLFCSQVPPAHGPVRPIQTSGSSGVPVRVLRTALNQLFWFAYTLREHQWWRRDVLRKFGVIRLGLPQERLEVDTWGPPVSLVCRSGPAIALAAELGTVALADALKAARPAYLLGYPTALQDLARHFLAAGERLPGLLEMRAFGETVTEQARRQVRQAFGCEIVDSYSCQEVGVIALQCPVSGHYHVMAESLLVEVLNARGEACRPGEIGDVVITDLHNFATPLVRYALGDQAEVAGPCACGRNLPTLRRILGRYRNMLVYPDGRRSWPRTGFESFPHTVPIVQHQYIQLSSSRIEVRLVVARPLDAAEEEVLRAGIQGNLGHPFDIAFRYFQGAIPRGANGKFEEFICTL